MRVSAEGKFEISLDEMMEIISKRQENALTDPTMSDWKSQNYLICCMNDGVNIMTKYMKDYCQRLVDDAKFGGGR